MKIARPIRDAHENGKPLYQQLMQEVRAVLKPRVEERGWFYRDRVKALESYALKVETGRAADYTHMEDFFGCKVIVPNFSHIPEAIQLISDTYQIEERRPKVDGETHNSSSDFIFDELRLYVKIPPVTDRPAREFDSLKFEIQIKTILQYAWDIATHDLIYKTDDVSWPKERIAYQVKAMLEHAELTIAEAGKLATAPAVSKQDRRTKDMLTVIEELRKVWTEAESLPEDLKRLADSIVALFKAGDLAVETLSEILAEEQKRVGLLPKDLSPYAFVVQALVNNPTLNFETKFKRDKVRAKIVIHDDMDLPASMRAPHSRIIVLRAVSATE